ncbi:MAG: hypothetical protein ACM32I_05625 [Nitrospirota bacterium]
MKIPRSLISILAIFPLISISACFPYHFTMRPGASGQVIDSNSKQPIENATISLTAYSAISREEEHESVNTQKDGSFLIPAKQKWSVVILGPFDPLPLKGQISMKADGYLNNARDIRINTMGPAISKFGVITLDRSTQQ